MRDGRRLSIGVVSGQGRMIYGTKRDCTEVSWDLSLQPLRDLVWDIIAGMEHVDPFSRCEGRIGPFRIRKTLAATKLYPTNAGRWLSPPIYNKHDVCS